MYGEMGGGGVGTGPIEIHGERGAGGHDEW